MLMNLNITVLRPLKTVSSSFKQLYTPLTQLRSQRYFSSSSLHCNSSSQEAETSHFNELASSWWDVNGPQRILHKMNLVRMDFIQETLRNNIRLNDGDASGAATADEIYIPGYSTSILPEEIATEISKDQEATRSAKYSKLRLSALDIGCGGGILSESLGRLPIIESVKGIDLADKVIEVAQAHKNLDPVIADKITYEKQSVELLDSNELYDVVTMFEILEHVDEPELFLQNGLNHLKKNGVLFVSTINKDLISWFTTIFMGEYILRIVPVGTHHVSKYVDFKQIEENINYKQKGSYKIINSKGTSYLPFYGWFIHNEPNFGNYFMAIKRV